ncbi:MAG: UDP-2,4-diacetamido-2,4,6-trideoxy-beta-L-altropyranose hydrolase [Magnetospirillum sp.]|nr:UDP-2,4-diacetamido-2,4,6-trideoxy-beta-L-altropyranose hydrolase [Magnetospirillum sp.]
MVDFREEMSARRAVFRFDASPAIGGGHATRCLVLVQALMAAGWEVTLAVNPEAAATVPALTAFAMVPVTQADELAVLAGLGPVDLLVIDHYGRDAGFETACRAFARTLLVVDDMRRIHDCDLVLDQNLGSRPEDYQGRIPAHCQVLAGPAFALLRPAFPAARAQALARRSGRLERILVCFGMTDPADLTRQALAGIREANLPVLVDVAIGPAAVWLDRLRQESGCTLHVGAGPQEMADLAAGADVMISPAGSVVWEACCLGLPQLLALSAENQRPGATALAASGAAEILSWDGPLAPGRVAAALRALAADPARIAGMSRAAAGVCDGLGPERVVQRCLVSMH